MALTTVPYLAAASQNADWRFGGFLLAVEDGNSYIAKMGEGARGAWLFTLPYSTEPQRGVLIYSFYLLLGRLAGPNHDAQVIVYHAARIVCGVGLLLASYLFLAEFFAARQAAAAGAHPGGAGRRVRLAGGAALPARFARFACPSISFRRKRFSLTLFSFAFPHLAAARGLFLLAFTGILARARRPGWPGVNRRRPDPAGARDRDVGGGWSLSRPQLGVAAPARRLGGLVS